MDNVELSPVIIIFDFVTISSTGNATDFGDVTHAVQNGGYNGSIKCNSRNWIITGGVFKH